jgi:hypothetical protein
MRCEKGIDFVSYFVLTLAVCKKKNAPIEPKIVQLERKYFFQKSISVI